MTDILSAIQLRAMLGRIVSGLTQRQDALRGFSEKASHRREASALSGRGLANRRMLVPLQGRSGAKKKALDVHFLTSSQNHVAGGGKPAA